jgi:hypothetical protein
MDSEAFRNWLTEPGRRFEHHEEDRGNGLAAVTVHREGRTARAPLIGSRTPIDIENARAVCQALALAWSEPPGPAGRA